MEMRLLNLLQLSDPTLPIGGYAHSGGLETYVQSGIVCSRDTACDYIRQMLTENICYGDAAFASLAYEAVCQNDIDECINLDTECAALKLPREIREASMKLGNRLLKVFQPVLQNQVLDQYVKAIRGNAASGHYCLAFGICAAAMGISKEEMLTGFYYNASVGMVTNSVKMIPLGQQQGQELLFSLQPLIAELVQKNIQPDRDLLGLCCTGFDIRCMQHETLYSRLYMS
ncbi:MAG: urease accessory protein UreF [Dyadobacter sp.]|nr:urease accessory protein UreF [Dyadobacter sp.]